MLTLSLAGITIRFTSFLNNEYPRTTIELSTVEFSTNGTPAQNGVAFEAKHLWSINAPCTPDLRDKLEMLTYEFHRRNRLVSVDSDITVWDSTRNFKEPSPRTRDIVPGGLEQVMGSGFVAYPAVFKAALTENPKFSSLGKIDSVSFQLTETIKALAV